MVEYLHCRPRNPSNSRSKPAQIKNTAWRRLGLPVIHTPWIDPHLHGSTQWKEEEDEGITCCPSGSRRFERMEEAEAPSERKMEGGEAHRWFIPEGMARGGVTLGFLRSPACTRVPNFWSSRSLASACTRRNGGEMLSGDAGRGLGFARREPGWGGCPGNQSAVGCTPQAWPAHIQGTKRVHSS
jgi:hypothetical protein